MKGTISCLGRVALSNAPIYLAVLFVFALFSTAHSAPFSVSSIDNTLDISVMEVDGNYDANLPDGIFNTIPREEIAKHFFKTHPDNYDFLVIFTNFDFQMPQEESAAFYTHIKNDVQGIGLDVFDNSSSYGSNARLQGTIDMGNLSAKSSDPLSPDFSSTMYLLSHELLHRWAAQVKYRAASGAVSRGLIGRDGKHWSFLLDTDGSVGYGNQWVENGDGTFTSLPGRKYFSQLDLYLMGLADKSEVPPMLLIFNPDIDQNRVQEAGVSITGTAEHITIEDIVVAEGERIPNFGNSQKSFKIGCIYITKPGTYSKDELYKIREIIENWQTWFSSLTRGRSSIALDAPAVSALPTNSGPDTPTYTDRIVPPEINDGVAWLINNQETDGSWHDSSGTVIRDTSTVLEAIQNFPNTEQAYNAGLQWLSSTTHNNSDYLARKVELLSEAGSAVSTMQIDLYESQNQDGGWGNSNNYVSNPADGALALKALKASGFTNQTSINKAISYLIKSQNNDGGWGGNGQGSEVQASVNVLSALASHQEVSVSESVINAGVLWLLSKQNLDGGFGNSPSTVYDTAYAIIALREFNAADDVLTPALNYLLALQAGNGSWNNSPYQTALAVKAIWESKRKPDLSITTANIQASPATITSLPTEITLAASIENLGLTSAQDVKVVIYDGALVDQNKIDEKIINVAGESSTPLTFTSVINDGLIHRYYFAVDPENDIEESSESNNKAIIAIYPEPTLDFEISPDDLVVSGTEFDLYQEVNVSVNVKNLGTRDVSEVALSLYLQTPEGPHSIGTKGLNIPAGRNTLAEFTWPVDVAGEHLNLTVEIDPADTFSELSETNNKVQRPIKVNPSTKPNLRVLSGEIFVNPTPALQAGVATISATVRNNGFSSASNVTVDFYLGVPGAGGKLIGQATIDSLEPGSEVIKSIDWQNIPLTGEQIFTVNIDSQRQIDEINESDNSGFIVVDILSLPDLEIHSGSINLNPAAPSSGETVTVTITVVNTGEQGVTTVPVSIFLNGVELETQDISLIAGSSQASTSFIIDTTGLQGAAELSVAVDKDNAILEQDEDNNYAARTVGVQDADLWLSERYISPNGDGVQDTTGFFYRLESPQTVSVVIVNEENEAVRTFQGGEFQNTTGGLTAWDGRNDQGQIVDDGDYSIQVKQADTIINDMAVTVDNNMSSIVDALGTEYLYSYSIDFEDITRNIDSSYEFIPNEGGIVWTLNRLHTADQWYSSPLYPEGVYISDIQGEVFHRIVPEGWVNRKFIGINLLDYYRFNPGVLSPDGSKYAFVVDFLGFEHSNTYSLLLVDTKTYKTKILEERVYPTPRSFSFSNDGGFIYYSRNSLKKNDKIVEMNTSGLDISSIDINNSNYGVKWSLDNKKISMVSIDGLVIIDTEGNELFNYHGGRYGYAAGGVWLSDGKLLFLDENNIPSFVDTENTFKVEKLYSYSGINACGSGFLSLVKDSSIVSYNRKDNKLGYMYGFEGNWVSMHEEEICGSKNCYANICNNVDDLSPDQNYSIGSFYNSWLGGTYAFSFDINKKMSNVIPTYVDNDLCGMLDDILDSGVNFKFANLQEICGTNQSIEISVYRREGWFDRHHKVVRYNKCENDDSDVPCLHGYALLDVSDGSLKYFPEGVLEPEQYGDNYFFSKNTIWGSSLNLKTELSPQRNDLSVIIKGTAIDKNFAYYTLEYASEDASDDWHFIKPPSENTVVADVLVDWVPPQSGRYLIRLTAHDKAGNVSVKRCRVSWDLERPIVNLYKENEYFSPNNDGAQDEGVLRYMTLEPISPEFNVYDQNDALVKTILMDHPLPGDQKMSWDGSDNQGRVVSDGIYRINFNRYDFYFEVDNTSPSASLEFGDARINPRASTSILANMAALAQDKNLANWKLEYSSAVSSTELYEYSAGESALVKKDSRQEIVADEYGNPLPVDLKVFCDQDLQFLVGKVFRLTVKDFAGNQSIVEGIFNDELFLINAWDSKSVEFVHDDGGFESSPDNVFAEINTGQESGHVIDVINTTQAEIVSVTLQYRKNMQWQEGPELSHDPTERQNYRWDSRSVDVNDIVAIRLMAEDEIGRIFFTNEIKFNSNVIFVLQSCKDSLTAVSHVVGTINLFDNLYGLGFQIISDSDPAYLSWTDIRSYEADSIMSPIEWAFSPDEHFGQGYSYQLRMVGISESGQEMFSNVQYPFENCGSSLGSGGESEVPIQYNDLGLNIIYTQAECNKTSNEASVYLSGTLLSPPSRVDYYIGISGEYKLLKSFDYASQGLGKILLDTSAYPEGSYPIRVTFGGSQSPIVPEQILLVDHMRPAASISYPLGGTPLCPQKINSENGTCFNIDIEGVANDNTQVGTYRLFYDTSSQTDPGTLFEAKTYPNCNQLISKPIAGTTAKIGKLGTWTKSESLEIDHSLYLQVVDSVGNKTCVQQDDIPIDTRVDVVLKSDMLTISPNGDSFRDHVNLEYSVNEYSEIDLIAYGPFPDSKISDADLNQMRLFRTISSGSVHLGGSTGVVWDGAGDSGQVGGDGWYRILISATDICGNNNQKYVDIEIDNMPPRTTISYPVADESINALSVEIRGTADEHNFESYRLEAINSAVPAQTILLATGLQPRAEDLLGVWNTYGMIGEWQLHLTARDSVGNESEAVTHISLLPKVNLISALSISPQSFSPNADSVSDSAMIEFALANLGDVAVTILDDQGNIVRVFGDLLSVADSQILAWNGLNSNDEVVPDGDYKVVVKASLATNSAIFQEESVTVKVDNTFPVIEISSPEDQSFLADSRIPVVGDITDNALEEYRIVLSHDNTTNLLDSGRQSKSNQTFSILDNLGDGLYALNLTAVDNSGNKKEEIVQFTLDRAPPEISVLKPLPKSIVPAGQNVISFEGLINEQNFSSLQIKYALGENPSQWLELFSTQQLPENPVWYEWNLDSQNAIADGLYSLLFTVTDKAGNTGAQTFQITIDRNPPNLGISSPAQFTHIHEQIDIIGAVSDYLLKDYQLSLAEGGCDSGALRWSPIAGSDQTIEGKLSTLPLPPADGTYCLKLSASDQAGNKSSLLRDISVDTHPPAAPLLSGEYTPRVGMVLTWPANTESDVAGFDIYRNGGKIAFALPGVLTMTDTNLAEGEYVYRLKVSDLGGLESEYSNEVSIVIDVTGPDASITSPFQGDKVSDLVDVRGSAYSNDFKEYRIYLGMGTEPQSWSLVRRSPLSTKSQLLTQLDTLPYTDGFYSLKLEAEDSAGNINSDIIVIDIDNTPPIAPTLVSATPSGSTINLGWLANSESDLTGYLLFRNHNIVNASGPVFGNYEPYLLNGISYGDTGVPDGNFSYYLIAMDDAGNLSAPSNSISINLNTHAPHVKITNPTSGYIFEGTVGVDAESPDIDISQVQFEYKKATESVWHTLGQPVSQKPFSVIFDPGKLGLPYGDYRLRAVATDESGKRDSAPEVVAITFTDLTPPSVPRNLHVRADGGTATIEWAENAEGDLAGYNVYTFLSTPLNAALLTTPRYVYPPNGSPELGTGGGHGFSVSAVDMYGNESEKVPVYVTIFTPQLNAPSETPTQNNIQTINGLTLPSCAVDVFRTNDGVENKIGAVVATDSGDFGFEVDLLPGDNEIKVKATDPLGNISKFSYPISISYAEPLAAPTGLTASVDSYDVDLNWNQNQETSLSGYHVYRDGVRLSATVPDLSLPLTSGSAAFYDTRLAYDGDPGTYLIMTVEEGSVPCWWQLDFQRDINLSQMKISWYEGNNYSAKDYEVQAWNGSVWIAIQTIVGNTESINNIHIATPIVTNKIRLWITSANDYWDSTVMLSEVSVIQKTYALTAYMDRDLDDGVYKYQVSAYDLYNFESQLSEPLSVAVGDVVPPEAPTGLNLSVSGSTVALWWSPNSEADLAGYNIYRSIGDATREMLNSSIDAQIYYNDIDILNGQYKYSVSAVDHSGNESGFSNTVEATIERSLPVPQNLVVGSLPVGQSIKACWDSLPDATGYILHRAETAGGPYINGNAIPVTENCFTDHGLTNGATYYYVVSAVDGIGNESGYSNEAGAVPLDEIDPAKPILTSPTVSGLPALVASENVLIEGYGEPGAEIALYKNSQYFDTAQSTTEPDYRSFPLYYAYGDFVPSPDGKYVSYNYYNYYLFIVYSDSAATKKYLYSGKTSSFAWSFDSNLIAYTALDSLGNGAISIFGINDSAATRLTNDVPVAESSPSWSRDGRLCFISNRLGTKQIWLKDFVTGSLSQVTYSAAPELVKFAPDGQKILYVGVHGLYLINLATDETIEVDDHIVDDGTGQSINWSPDSKQIAYVSDKSGTPDVFVYDLSTSENSQVTLTATKEISLAWSADGQQVVYVSEELTGSDIWSCSVVDSSCTLVRSETVAVDNLHVTPSGAFFYGDTTTRMHKLIPAGLFSFFEVPLADGENLFHARGRDSAGNVGPESDPISVSIDPSILPDMVTLAEDIVLFPGTPLVGEEVGGQFTVRNQSAHEALAVAYDVYLLDPASNLEHVSQGVIPSLPAHSEEIYSFTWDSAGREGVNKIYVVLDGQDLIREANEDNNFAVKSCHVISSEGIQLTTRINGTEFNANEYVSIENDLFNSGFERTFSVEVSIEDLAGFVVDVLPSTDVLLPYGESHSDALSWRAGSVYAGSYLVRTVVKAGDEILVEKVYPFSVLPDINLQASVVADKIHYGPDELVRLTSKIENLGGNYIIPALDVRISVHSAGALVYSVNSQLSNLFTESSASLSAYWPTAYNIPGEYTGTVTTYYEGLAVAEDAVSFWIDPVFKVTGNLRVSSKLVPFGSPASVAYTLSSSGNIDGTDLALVATLIDNATQSVIGSRDLLVDMGANDALTGVFSFAATDLHPGSFKVILFHNTPDGLRYLASDTFSVIDRTPPVVEIISPLTGDVFNEAPVLSVKSVDNSAGVESVEYRIDSGSWLPLRGGDPASSIFSSVWQVVESDEGAHAISFHATDRAGNLSVPVTTEFTLAPKVDMVGSSSASQYLINEDLVVKLSLTNHGWPKTVQLQFWVEDAEANVVHAPDPQVLRLLTDEIRTTNLSWNVGAIWPGVYKAHSVLTKNGIALAEQGNSFEVLPAVVLTSALRTDKQNYTIQENIQFAVVVESKGNFIIPGMSARLVIADPSGNQVHSELLAIENLEPGTQHHLQFAWNTAQTRAGTYSATVQVVVDGRVESTSAAVFTIDPVLTISGHLTLSREEVPQGEAVAAAYEITNVGNVLAVALPLRLSVHDARNVLVTVLAREADLDINGTHAAEVSISTTDLAIGAYKIALGYEWQHVSTVIGEATFRVIDNTPPEIRVISPRDGDLFEEAFDLLAIVTDDSSGVANVDYQLDGASWQSMSIRDPLSGLYGFNWTPVMADEGEHVVVFRAIDNAGNVAESVPATINIVLCKPFDELTGSLNYQPQPLYYGEEIVLDYQLSNNCAKDIVGLTTRLIVKDPASATVLVSITAEVGLTPNGTAAGSFNLSTLDALAVQSYMAVLQVESADRLPRELASLTFDVLPALNVSANMSDHTDLLVWVNYQFNSHSEYNCYQPAAPQDISAPCLRKDLLERILGEAAHSYHIVYDRPAFEDELRNPLYTDILILGDQYQLTDHLAEELREKVYAGMGLISSGWLLPGDHEFDHDQQRQSSLLGIKLEGRYGYDRRYLVLTDASPITSAGELPVASEIWKVVADSDSLVAGWLVADGHVGGGRPVGQGNGGVDDLLPAMVLHDYGLGRSVYLAFDFGMNLSDANFVQMSEIIQGGVRHVHFPDLYQSLYPYEMKPVDLLVQSPGRGYDLKFNATWPLGLVFYDPSTDHWYDEGPWQPEMTVAPAGTSYLRFYVLAPEEPGDYALKLQSSIMENGYEYILQNDTFTFNVAASREELMAWVVSAVESLNLSGKDRAKAGIAVEYLEQVRSRAISCKGQIEDNIHDLEKALEGISTISEADIQTIRLELDRLLRIEQSRWYLYTGPAC